MPYPSRCLPRTLAICFIVCVALSTYWWKWLLSIENQFTNPSPAVSFLTMISVPLLFSTLTVFLLSIWAMRRVEPIHLLAGVGIGLTSLVPAAWIALWNVRNAPVLGVFLYAWTAFFYGALLLLIYVTRRLRRDPD